MATAQTPIEFFDIASGPPKRCFAPNPWKTRYALNIKAVPYKTIWVELPDVKSTRMAYNVRPVRKFPDNSDFYTLPMINDPAAAAKNGSSNDNGTDNGTWVGDSFDIAVYLDEQYPDSGERLFPPDSIGIHRVFNAHVDALFTRHVVLCSQYMPLNPETAEQTKADFVKRLNLERWEQLCVEGEAREKLLQAFEADLEEFAKLWRFGDQGPFLEGARLTYADVIVGGWLQFAKGSLPEWERICEWQGGRWKRLIEALEPWAKQG